MKAGDKVWVVNCNMRGEFIVEGRALVRKPPKTIDAQAFVDFDAKKNAPLAGVWRWIDPAAQSNPKAYVADLNKRITEARQTA